MTWSHDHLEEDPLDPLDEFGPLDSPGEGWLDNLRNNWQWDDLASEVSRESQARVAIVGLRGVGKSLLFNRLRGWQISRNVPSARNLDEIHVEPYGAFVLGDLPAQGETLPAHGDEFFYLLGDPALTLYLIDAARGVQSIDYRWIALIRARGRPLVVALNKCDAIEDVATAVAEAERRLGMPVVAISAYTGANVETRLLPALLDAAPRLAVPLGREILSLRRVAARRVIRQTALFAGMLSAQPIPLLDLPFQAALQVGLVMRVGAAYGSAPTGGVNREMVATVVGALGMRYLAQTLLKFVPILGWFVSGSVGAAATYLIGEAAIGYYEAGGRIPLRDWLARRPRFKMPRWIPSRAGPVEVFEAAPDEYEIPVSSGDVEVSANGKPDQPDTGGQDA